MAGRLLVSLGIAGRIPVLASGFSRESQRGWRKAWTGPGFSTEFRPNSGDGFRVLPELPPGLRSCGAVFRFLRKLRIGDRADSGFSRRRRSAYWVPLPGEAGFRSPPAEELRQVAGRKKGSAASQSRGGVGLQRVVGAVRHSKPAEKGSGRREWPGSRLEFFSLSAFQSFSLSALQRLRSPDLQADRAIA